MVSLCRVAASGSPSKRSKRSSAWAIGKCSAQLLCRPLTKVLGHYRTGVIHHALRSVLSSLDSLCGERPGRGAQILGAMNRARTCKGQTTK
jgi:hypothetical protein